jgi:hypothetical protein
VVNITEEHLHHMAKRHHATMQKLDSIRDKYAGMASRWAGTGETLAGAWLGGTIEGRTAGAALGPLPVNLGAGIALLAVSHFDLAGDKWGKDLQNVGNGFIGSWAAATGYAFGKRWKETGKAFGGGGHPWAHPYESGWSNVPAGPPPGPPPGLPIGPPAAP